MTKSVAAAAATTKRSKKTKSGPEQSEKPRKHHKDRAPRTLKKRFATPKKPEFAPGAQNRFVSLERKFLKNVTDTRARCFLIPEATFNHSFAYTVERVVSDPKRRVLLKDLISRCAKGSKNPDAQVELRITKKAYALIHHAVEHIYGSVVDQAEANAMNNTTRKTMGPKDILLAIESNPVYAHAYHTTSDFRAHAPPATQETN